MYLVNKVKRGKASGPLFAEGERVSGVAAPDERESKRERDPLTVVFNNAMAVTPSHFGQEYLLGCVNSRHGQRKSRNLNPCSQYSFWRHVYANRPIVRVPIFAPVSRSPSFLRRLHLILFFARSPL